MWSMIVDTNHDIRVFVCTLLCGALSGFILDIFRAIRRSFTPGKTMVAIQDIITCAIIFTLFSCVINKENDGDVRWFEFAGAILGASLYFCTLSMWTMKCLNYIMIFLKRIGSCFLKFGLNIRKELTEKLSVVKGKTARIRKKLFLIMPKLPEKIFGKSKTKKN